MSPRARAVLFDLDGVLVDSYDVWFHVMNRVARDLGYAAIAPGAFADMWGQGIEQDVERCFPRHDVAEIERRYDALYLDHAERLRFDAEGPAVIAALRGAGCGLALVTNTPAPIARAVLERGGLALDAVVGGTDVPNAKPAPDMVLAACRALRASTDDAVLVGDTHNDRDAARAAGVRFVGFRMDGDARADRLSELPALLGVG